MTKLLNPPILIDKCNECPHLQHPQTAVSSAWCHRMHNVVTPIWLDTIHPDCPLTDVEDLS